MESEKQGLVSTRVMEVVVGLFLFVLGLILIFDAHRLGYGWGDSGPMSGYFPFYIGLILCASSLVAMISGWRASGAKDPFVERGQAKLVLAVLIPTALYIVAIAFVGIYVASVLFIAVFMAWQGKFKWAKCVTVSVLVTVALFLMFEIWFKVPLPKGPLEALFGY